MINWLQAGKQWPHDQERLERYEHNEALFRGDQDAVYKADFLKRLIRRDEHLVVEVIANFPGAVTKLFTDLLFGERPTFMNRMDDEAGQNWLDEFIAYNRLHRLNLKAALAQSYRGDAVYKLRLRTGEPHSTVQVIPAKFWFPLIDESDITEKRGDVIAYEVTRGEGSSKLHYVVAEIHYPGEIQHQVWRLLKGKLQSQVRLDEFYEDPPPEVQETGVDQSLVFVVPNMEVDDSPFGIDDYEEADTLFRELSIRLSQPSRILDKHSDPNMYGPPISEHDHSSGEDVVASGGRYIEIQGDESPPGYLAWDGQLASNWKYIEELMKHLYIVTDTNEAAFSLMTGGSVPSGTALKRLLMRPLARTNRKREFFDDTLRELLQTAAAFERANGRTGAPEHLEVEIQWQDGLPADEHEDAQIEHMRTGGKATSSVRSSIRRLDRSGEGWIEEELERIADDEEAPPVPLPAGAFDFGEDEEE